MANARTRFDTIRDYMMRAHEATSGQLFGKPCALYLGRPFIAFHLEGMGFKMRGRIRLQALALPGTQFWDPLLPDRPDPDWVWVPSTHFLRWDRLAIEAYRQQKEQGTNAVARITPSPASAPLVPRPAGPYVPAAASPRPAPPPPAAPRPAPNWAERLKQLTGWMKWTTSRPGE